MEFVRSWVESSPYSQALGVGLDTITESSARLLLPYRETNSNPGQALHGGCAASLAAIGGQAVTRAALGANSGPWHTAAVQVNYLAAAIGEDVAAEARLLRRGKDVCFVEIDVAASQGKSIAHATALVRARHGDDAAVRYSSSGDDGSSDPGAMGPLISLVPFIGNRQMVIENMVDSRSRISMPFNNANADQTEGVHEGAILALLDTTGAMASWAETGPGPYKASTPSLQAQILAPAPKQDLVAYGWVVQRDGAVFWTDAEVVGAVDGRVVARGTVIYRIVT